MTDHTAAIDDAHATTDAAYLAGTRTRYRVTIDGETRWSDARPSDDRLARMEEFVMNRGGHARVDECTMMIDPATNGTGRGITIDDHCIFEIEG